LNEAILEREKHWSVGPNFKIKTVSHPLERAEHIIIGEL
jgi:hypothetical protein